MEKCVEFLSGSYYEFTHCFVPAGSSESKSVFEISDYLAALALLLVIYTISDYRSRFRLSLSRLPVYKLSFWIFLIVFSFKALAEIWFYNRWFVFEVLDNRILIDSVLLIPCVLAIMIWVYVSYVSPPVFSRWNSHRFFWAYQKVVHHGTQEELRVALHELARSARPIIKFAQPPHRNARQSYMGKRVESAANSMLLLLGNRRLCAELAATSPDTAAEFFREISWQRKFDLPYGMFAQNVAAAMLTDKSSPIFHEDSVVSSGWSGYVQLYSREIFSNLDHISSLSGMHQSPLDIRYHIAKGWDAENWRAYTRVALLYADQLIKERPQEVGRAPLRQILEVSKIMVSGLSALNGADGSYFRREEYEKLLVLVGFIRDILSLLSASEVPHNGPMKPDNQFSGGIYEELAQLIGVIILRAAAVREPISTCWDVNYNSVWSSIFGYDHGGANVWVYRRVCRIIYYEIRRMDRHYNFKGAAYLGFCLNVLGLSCNRHQGFRDEESPLRLAVLKWVRENYSHMREVSPKVAEACLHGSVSFDDRTFELVKTYMNDTKKTSPEERFAVSRFRP